MDLKWFDWISWKISWGDFVSVLPCKLRPMVIKQLKAIKGSTSSSIEVGDFVQNSRVFKQTLVKPFHTPNLSFNLQKHTLGCFGLI